MNTPVTLFIFNRPHTTEEVLTQIARVKPSKLFVVADGPRPGFPVDAEKCEAARAVIKRVDWYCEVIKSYSDVNLGCGRRVASGISWVFEQVERAIILEDDCVPHPTFFRFCEELLEKYRDDERVMHISGTNFQFGRRRVPYSYFFSWHNLSWGWASWRRAWRHYDMGVKLWPILRNTDWLLDIVGDPRAAQYWQEMFHRAHAGGSDVDYWTWDHQWTFACWAQNGLSILPVIDLVSNIGFGRDASHTKSIDDPWAKLIAGEMIFPLKHPPYVTRDTEADRFFIDQVVQRHIPQQPGLYHRFRSKCASVLPRGIHKRLSYLRSK